MPKKPEKKIQKQTFNIKDYKESKGLTRKIKNKELSWIPLSGAFQEALGIPGIPRGYTTLSRGYTNTGKSTSIYEAIVGAQKIGDLPIIFDTENNFNWEHARMIGMQFEDVIDEETGELTHEGDFIFLNGRALLDLYSLWDYDEAKEKSEPVRNEPVIEDIARFIDEIMDDQEAGKIQRSCAFFWDSIGSLDCFKSVKSKSKNNMWNANALESAFKSILNFRIPDTQRFDCPYTNSFFAVQKIWYDNMNMKIKHKGGEAFFYGARLIIHFGGILSHGTTKKNAQLTNKGVMYKYQFGIEADVKCEKNQITGIEQMGKLLSTPHGYVNPAKEKEYKEEKKDYIIQQLTKIYNIDGINGELEITSEEGNLSDYDKSA
jgi:recA bacterial DNA recombination protein